MRVYIEDQTHSFGLSQVQYYSNTAFQAILYRRDNRGRIEYFMDPDEINMFLKWLNHKSFHRLIFKVDNPTNSIFMPVIADRHFAHYVLNNVKVTEGKNKKDMKLIFTYKTYNLVQIEEWVL